VTAQLDAPGTPAVVHDVVAAHTVDDRTAGHRDAALTDDVLARRAGAGDEQAFTVLVDRHGPGLHRHTSRLLADPRAVEDCLQETLIAAWRGLPGFRGQASVKTWLFTIARRQAYAQMRLAGSADRAGVADPTEVLERIADLRDDPARSGVESGLREALDLALTLLPRQQRSAWILKEVEELTYAEIAAVLGVTSGSVRGLLARARASLAVSLAAWR